MSKKLDFLINLPTNLDKFIDETTTSIANVIDEGNAARAAERAAAQQRAVDQGYTTKGYSGSTHDITAFDGLLANPEGDW